MATKNNEVSIDIEKFNRAFESMPYVGGVIRDLGNEFTKVDSGKDDEERDFLVFQLSETKFLRITHEEDSYGDSQQICEMRIVEGKTVTKVVYE